MVATANLVHETTTGTGTGDLTLVPYSQSFDDAFGNGATTNVFFYFIQHRTLAEWEWGTGHMSDTDTLVRDTVIESSNSNAAVSFSAGTKDVCGDLPVSLQNDFQDDKGSVGTGTVTFSNLLNKKGKLTVTGNLTVAFSGWPASGKYKEYEIELVNGGSAVVTWPTVNWLNGDGTSSTTFADMSVTLQASGTNWVVVWSTDGGSTLYGRAA